MKALELSNTTKKNIAICVGKPFENISLAPSVCNIINYDKKIDTRKIGCGNPLLARKKNRDMSEVNEKIERIK